MFWKKVWELPEGSKTAKGRPVQNLINIEPGDSIRGVINVADLKDEDYINNNFVVMCTEKGTIKKTTLEAYSRPRTNGINAITINEGDRLLDIKLTNGDNHIIIGKRSGKVVHFHESQTRAMGRTAAGVRGVRLEGEDDRVVGMVCVNREDANLLVVSEKGYGKRSAIADYRITKRGGKGVKTINITEKTGNLVAIKEVIDTDDLMIINKSGITIRISVAGLRVMGRATQGVRVIRLNEGDAISSVEKIELIEVEEEAEAGEAITSEGENTTTEGSAGDSENDNNTTEDSAGDSEENNKEE